VVIEAICLFDKISEYLIILIEPVYWVFLSVIYA